MNPLDSSPTPAPIHDIVGPIWIFPYPLWMVLVGIVGLCGGIALLVWFVLRKRPSRPLTPRERALAVLAELRREGSEADSYTFGVRVSDALRTYIRDQYGLDALTRTSLEFLESVRESSLFSDNEKATLSEFLESVDLLKYAHFSALPEEMESLLQIAERLVQGEQAPLSIAVK